jgi:hypothetical protein
MKEDGLDRVQILLRKLEVLRPLVRHKLGWEDNIKMDIIETDYGVLNLIQLPQDRLVVSSWCCVNGPYSSKILREFCE